MTLIRLIAVAAAAAALGGCFSLFPKADPAQLYRFEPAAMTPIATPGAAVSDLALGPVAFDPASGSDRILTMTGAEAAYVKSARWVSPASLLFTDALERAFDSGAPRIRLVDRRRATATSAMLDVNVDRFETRYDSGSDGVPTVVVSLSARLIRYPDRQVIADHRFEAREAAADNRMGAIVPAYNAATARVLAELVTWTDQAVGGR